MVKKRGIRQKIIILFIILLVFIRISYSYGGGMCGELADGTPISCSISDPNLLQYGDYDNPAFPWDQIDQSQIPTDRISEIPTDKVQVNDVADKSKLTKEQLEYNNNINKVPDWKELNQDVVGDILSDKINKNVKVNDADSGQVGDNSFSIPSVSSLTIEDTSFSSPNIINYNNDMIYVKNANQVIVKESILNKIKDYAGNDKMLKTHAFDGELVLSDGSKVKYKSLADDSEIYLNENDTVIVKKGILDDGQHTVISNSSEKTLVNYEKGKIRCAYIVLSTYIIEDNELYAIYEPVDGVNFNMCFRNYPEQVIEMNNCLNCGLFDFVDNEYFLAGFIQFQKKPYLINKNEPEEYFMTIFDGKGRIKAAFYDLIFMEEFILNSINSDNLYLSYTNPTNYLKIKEENGRTYLNKQQLLNQIISTSFIHNYVFDDIAGSVEDQILTYKNIKIYPSNSKRLKEVFE